jgi:hypothetical protein
MGTLRIIHRSKRPDSPKLARPKTKFLTHGGIGALLRDALDGRTRVAKDCRAWVAALAAYLGGEPTAVETELIEQAARLSLLVDVAWADLMRNGVLPEGQAAPAVEVFLKATRDHRAVPQLLGLERRVREVPSLTQYLQERASD